jgi:alkanesulfonate monooxygenase SsuD/methylene tetrahydromethanopterin reductase-like flavin-dependent oxidoreductase (luciferase family)
METLFWASVFLVAYVYAGYPLLLALWSRIAGRPPRSAPAGAPYAAGDFYEFHGKFYDLPSFKINPVPKKPIPILIGGHADAALRRAARLGDGWMHAGGGQAADLGAALA